MLYKQKIGRFTSAKNFTHQLQLNMLILFKATFGGGINDFFLLLMLVFLLVNLSLVGERVHTHLLNHGHKAVAAGR